MSMIERKLRAALQYLPIRAACHAASIALACAATLQAAQAQEATDAEHNRATIDFASCAKPVYPEADKQAGHQGTVSLGFLVDENGRILDSKVTGSSGYRGLDMAAQVALMKCRFHPALDNGKPVQKWAYVQYVWTLP